MASDWLIQKRGLGGATQTTVKQEPVVTPTKTQTPNASPTPIQKVTTKLQEIEKNPIVKAITTPQRIMTAGLGKIGEALSAPQRFVQEKITGGKGYEDFYTSSPVGKAIVGGAKNKLVQAILPPAAAFSTPKRAALASELALDPLNLVGAGVVSKAAKAVKLPQLATKIASAVGKTTVGKYIGKAEDIARTALQYGYKVDPRILRKYEALTGESEKALQYAKKVATPLMYGADGKKLPATTQKAIGDVMKIMSEGSSRALTADEIKILKQYEPTIQRIFDEFASLAKQQIKAGADPSIFQDLMGRYGGKLSYATKIQPKGIGKGIGLETGIYKKRQQLSDEARKALGQIIEPAYGAATAAFQEKRNISLLNFFKDVAKKEGLTKQAFSNLDEAAKLNYVQLPKDAKYGVLAGNYIPKQTANYIKPLVAKASEGGAKVAENITKIFKAGKTVMSPKQLGRNVLTSQIQAFLENPTALAYLPKAIKEKITGGKFYKALKETGEIAQSMPSQELASFLPEEIQSLTKGGKFSKAFSMLKKPGSAIQQGTEEVSKLQSFMARLYEEAGKLRIPIDEALQRKDLIEKARKAAEISQFNYQKVTPFISKMRKGAIPFLTYPTKAAELTARTLVKNPERLTALMKGEQAVQRSFKEPVNEQYLPDYLKQSIRVGSPDEKGATPYLNTKYLYPFGNLLETNPLPFGIGPNPLFTEAAAQLFDKDLLTGKEISKTGRIRHAVETFAPTPVRSIWQMYDALTKNPSSAISSTAKDLLIKETGLPYYKYSPQIGASIKSYENKEKVSNIKAKMRKYIKDYAGKKSPEEIQQGLLKFSKELESITK